MIFNKNIVTWETSEKLGLNEDEEIAIHDLEEKIDIHVEEN